MDFSILIDFCHIIMTTTATERIKSIKKIWHEHRHSARCSVSSVFIDSVIPSISQLRQWRERKKYCQQVYNCAVYALFAYVYEYDICVLCSHVVNYVLRFWSWCFFLSPVFNLIINRHVCLCAAVMFMTLDFFYKS